MRNARTLLLSLLVLFLPACATKKFAVYDVGLNSVERPADAKERYGETTIVRVDTLDMGKYVFEDDLVKIGWLFQPHAINFQLTNKTDHSMRIVWDEAAYLDPDGQSHRVMHAGIKYTDKEAPQPPTVVVRGGQVTDLVFPTSYVEWGYNSWVETPLFMPVWSYAQSELESAKDNIGQTAAVLLPLEVEGVVNEYLFEFEVLDVLLR